MTPAPTSPKILQLRKLRTAVVILLAAAAIAGYFFYTRAAASDSSPADTKDLILALKEEGSGSRAVLIHPDGSVTESPGAAGADDREAVWRPDGNRIFISRSIPDSKVPDESNYQLYRWNPANNDIQRRTIGTRALAHPRFALSDANNPAATALTTAGGRVLLFDPQVDSSIHQVLPPVSKDTNISTTDVNDSAGDTDTDTLFRGLGTSFREARWSSDKTFIVAVMRRENGEVLVVQKANPDTEEEKRPRPVIFAQHIDFDVNPSGNSVIFTALDFQWQDEEHVPDEFKRGGKITRPYNHLLGVLDLTKAADSDPSAVGMLASSKVDGTAFAEPAFSPDGKSVMVVGGAFLNGSEFSAQDLLLFSATGGSPQLISKGAIANPSWHPAGDRVLFVRRESNGERDIVMVSKVTGEQKSLTAGKGNFSHPKFSPQLAQAP